MHTGRRLFPPAPRASPSARLPGRGCPDVPCRLASTRQHLPFDLRKFSANLHEGVHATHITHAMTYAIHVTYGREERATFAGVYQVLPAHVVSTSRNPSQDISCPYHIGTERHGTKWSTPIWPRTDGQLLCASHRERSVLPYGVVVRCRTGDAQQHTSVSQDTVHYRVRCGTLVLRTTVRNAWWWEPWLLVRDFDRLDPPD